MQMLVQAHSNAIEPTVWEKVYFSSAWLFRCLCIGHFQFMPLAKFYLLNKNLLVAVPSCILLHLRCAFAFVTVRQGPRVLNKMAARCQTVPSLLNAQTAEAPLIGRGDPSVTPFTAVIRPSGAKRQRLASHSSTLVRLASEMKHYPGKQGSKGEKITWE